MVPRLQEKYEKEIDFAMNHGLEQGDVINAMKNHGWERTTDIPKDALVEFKNELEDLANYESIVQ